MEKREGFFWALLMISPLFCCTSARDPRGNVNLSPFQQWRSAYECLQNNSLACSGNFQLTEKGELKITYNETEIYCSSECPHHTIAVLECIYYVKHNYIFLNKATIEDVNNTISDGCNRGFTGATEITSSARKAYESNGVAIFVSLAAWLFVCYMNM